MYITDTVIGPIGTHARDLEGADLKWPAAGLTEVPDWIYTSPEVYQREVERIFHGPTWNYVALEAEIPKPGDYKRSYVGPTPVVVARDADGLLGGHRDSALYLDETRFVKKGSASVGVQRQYCGALGKKDNCLVSVHAGYCWDQGRSHWHLLRLAPWAAALRWSR